MLKEVVVFRRDNGVDKILRDCFVLDVLPVGLLEEHADLFPAVGVIDRAFHGKNFFNVRLLDLFAGIEDDEPEKGQSGPGDRQRGKSRYAIE